MLGFLEMLFLLCIGHAFGDVAFQTEWMAFTKQRVREGAICPGTKKGMWVFALTSHALINAGIVIIITGSTLAGLLEFIVHWLIDFGKCEGKYGMMVDQALHLTSKIVWCIL